MLPNVLVAKVLAQQVLLVVFARALAYETDKNALIAKERDFHPANLAMAQGSDKGINYFDLQRL